MATALGSCEFCEKSGLAILPVRAAIMRPDSGAPVLPAALQPVEVDGGRLPLDGPAAAYTGRTLRSGFLYVYDERDTWEKYWITEFGYLMKTPVGVPMDASYMVGREPCDKTGHKEIAACITVKEPKKASRIWVAFSNAEWTPHVLQLHQEEAYRKRHMRVFNVAAWMDSHEAEYAQSLDTVASVVAEYAPKTKVETFSFSLQTFRSRASTKDILLHSAASLGPGPGVLLMIDDPVGIASEIGTRLADANNAFMAKDERYRKSAVSSGILAIQGAVINRAQLDEIQASDDLPFEMQLAGQGIYAENFPAVDAADLQKAADINWEKYQKDYDEPARSQWQSEFNTEYSQFQKQTLLPLAKSHTAWMASTRMSNFFACTHDDQSADAGLVYTRTLTLCVQGTEQYEPCANQYLQWLTGTFSDEKNLLLRAMVLNIESYRKKMIESLKPDIPWRALGWDSLFASFNLAIGHQEQTPEVLGKLIFSISGSIARMLQQSADGPVVQGAVALGVASGHPVMPVEMSGRYGDFRTQLIRQLMSASGATKLSGNAMQREVSLALRRLQILGEPMNANVSSKFLVLIDEKMIKNIPEGLPKEELPKWLARSITTPKDMERLDLQALARVGATAGKTLPIVGNAIAALFQIAAYNQVSKDLADSLSVDLSENKWRLFSGKLALGATAADTLSKAADALAETTLLSGRAATLKFAASILEVSGKFVGFVGAAIGAVWDAHNTFKAIHQKNYPLVVTLGVSAASGAATSALLMADGLFFTATPVGWVIAAISIFIAAGIVTPFLQDNNIDEWLKRCYWGMLGKKERYQNADVEMRDLITVMGG